MQFLHKKPWLTIIGIGEDGLIGLKPAALTVLKQADYIFGASRHLAWLEKGEFLKEGALSQSWPRPFLSVLPKLQELKYKNVVILATGDPMHFGVGATLHRFFKKEEIQIFSHPSCFSLAAARLGWPLQDAVCCSIHGRELKNISSFLQDGQKLLVLSHDKHSPLHIHNFLKTKGFSKSDIFVLDSLGGSRERHFTLEEALSKDLSDLNLVAVICRQDKPTQWLYPHSNFPDSMFLHDGKITKENIRAIVILHLAPQSGNLLWDVGAGCGSIAIEWIRAGRGKVSAIAIERDKTRLKYLQHNSQLINPSLLDIIHNDAESVLDNLPKPDAIFIGGGFSKGKLVEKAWKHLKKGGRLVANAITLETEKAFYSFLKKHQSESITLLRFEQQTLEKLGSFHSWRPHLPLTMLIAQKH